MTTASSLDELDPLAGFDEEVPEPPLPPDDEAEGLDLDALLTESLTQADARKRARQGKTLSPADRRIVEDIERTLHWSPVAQVALFKVYRCENCGEEQTSFVGWYTVLRHRREADSRRLSLSQVRLKGIPAFAYHARESVTECPHCLSWVDECTFEEIDAWGLKALGQLALTPEHITSFKQECPREVLPPLDIWIWPDGSYQPAVEGEDPPAEAGCITVEGLTSGSPEDLEEAVLDYLTNPNEGE